MASIPNYAPSRIKTSNPHHEPWDLSAEERARYRELARDSRARREAANLGLGGEPRHEINVPTLDPEQLMPQQPVRDLSVVSLFSGGGGLDLGFDRAGFRHHGSWEILDFAAETLRSSRPQWSIHGGLEDGDVTKVDWRPLKGNIAVVHGGPPCQPFSNAGRQKGEIDSRNMWPEFVRAVDEIRPEVFVAENVGALASAKFSNYVGEKIIGPLSKNYHVHRVLMQAYEYGVPQARKRVFFFGFRTRALEKAWTAPTPTHRRPGSGDGKLPETPGVRAALGLPDIGFDDISPTIRSALGGPRNTTSILSSTSASRRFAELQVWPNGVGASRVAAQSFAAKNGHFRLSVPDVGLLQGFPESWEFYGAVYQRLGQIGNSVVPPVAYQVARSVAAVFPDK